MIGLARADLDLDALAELPDDEVRAAAHSGPRARPVDGRVVPRAPPRAAACVARRRPRPAQGGRNLLRSRRARARPPPRSVPEPRGPLPADRAAGRAAGMNIRRATTADEPTLRELWEEFEREFPSRPACTRDVGGGVGRRAQGHRRRRRLPRRGRRGSGRHARGRPRPGPLAHRARLRPPARPAAGRCEGAPPGVRRGRQGKGATYVSLDVLSTNTAARAVWERLGFEEVALIMATPVDDARAAARRRADRPVARPVHVQSDDDTSVERAVAQFVPRLAAPERRRPRRTAGSGSRIRCSTRTATRSRASRATSPTGSAPSSSRSRSSTRGRPRPHVRERADGRRVPLGADVPRDDLEGRRARARGEPDARRPPDRRRPRHGAAGDADGGLAGRLPPADELYDAVARTMGLEP